MKKFCQLQRLIAEQGLEAANPKGESKSGTHTQKVRNGFVISRADYDKVLPICRERRTGLQSCDDFSNTFNDEVLIKVSRKNPNNIVEYIWEEKKFYGEVVDIMKMGSGWDGVIFKLVRYNQVQCPAGVQNVMAELGVVQVTQGPLAFITEKDIVGPVAFRNLPAWTLGCRRISVLLCPLSTRPFQSTTTSPEVNLDKMDIDDEW
ncbi:hypothetical protein VP01_881g1 [Puccinia sorghi]|uniref:Uncharacterized protein n=1 Tax=Puccinia sorghi TaxID=27349 RepID=A0A0L6U8B4_9BASI|nr:hypothetical protein VP01_881g1 [Puccinia sorghi]